MTTTMDDSLYEQVKGVAREFERRHEQQKIAAREPTNGVNQNRHQGKSDAFEQAARRLRILLDEAGDEQ